MGERSHAQEMGDTPHGGGLHDVERPGGEERAELFQAGEVLAGGDRRPHAAPDGGHPVGVPASDWLLDLAEAGDTRIGNDAVMPGVVGKDVVTWPRLAAMAKRQQLPEEIRKQAIFWLGQEAAEHALGPLDTLLTDDPDREMRQAALFALTQQNNDRAIDILIRTARSHRDRETRRTAFFWLGKLVEFDRTEKLFTAPAEQLTEDYVTGRFG
jgi:hypothetical protein